MINTSMKGMNFKKWFSEWATVHDDAIARTQYLKLFDPKRLSTVSPENKLPGQQQDDPMRPDYLPKPKAQRTATDKLYGFMSKK